jgi:tetratricopeptide (TPR) repeat protein
MPEGRVKVLDFGLAKPAGGEAASQDITVTQLGSIIGTPAYMSPEQIRGGSTDSCTDIWSFGCILYEMLTGKRPFEGATVSDTVAHILECKPDWQALPHDTPANIKVLLRRCLDKGLDQRRQGKFEQALANIKRACDLDPLSSNITLQLAVTFMLLRKYTEAERYYERAILLSPDLAFPYFFKAGLYLLTEGNTEKAWAVFDRASQDTLENGWIVLRSIELNMFDADYKEALDRLSSYESEAFDTQFYFIPKAVLYAQINGLMGDQQLQETHYESARNILEIKIQEQPDDERFHSSLGIAYAGLGRKKHAISEGERGVELLPISKDAWRGQYRLEDLARIYVMVGEFDTAIEKIEHLLFIPGEMSIPLLKLDPAWDPIRDHPRFKKLIEADK